MAAGQPNAAPGAAHKPRAARPAGGGPPAALMAELLALVLLLLAGAGGGFLYARSQRGRRA